jgi:transcriptional/translational regulatory protein YebC/TACO1
LLEVALEAGADDVIPDEEGGLEVLCEPAQFSAVRNALQAAGLHAEIGVLTMRPETSTVLSGDDAERMQKLLDVIENLDDVQDVFTNAELS